MRKVLFLILCLVPLKALPNDSTVVAPKLLHTEWYCSHERLSRRVDIYLPAAYDTCPEPLPVIYLIHGINGYEGSWQVQGSAIDTLETLMAAGKCQPMILVMPDCNKWPYKPHPGGRNLWRYVTRYPRISREHEIEQSVTELMDWMDTTYRVASYCLIAGLSDGARIASNVARIRPDCIAAVGMFSPVVHRGQLPRPTTDTAAPTPLYCLYAGTRDIFYPSAKRFHRHLDRAGCTHRFVRLKGGHNWKMWRTCLSHFLQNMP